jgi:hypothetical protein
MKSSRFAGRPAPRDRWRWTILAMAVGLACVSAGASPAPETRYPDAPRIVALGDWHGDLDAARRGLRLAGAIDDQDRWVGGDLVVVQTGDQLDRGDQEQEILDLLDRLRDEAAAAGGAMIALLGNHELMNVAGDFRYVTPGGWADFADAGIPVPAGLAALDALPVAQRPRAAAFLPGGPYARLLAEQPLAVIIGRTVFVHGGLLPHHLEGGLDQLNRDTHAWLAGDGPEPAVLQSRDDPVWARHYSDEPDPDDCTLLGKVLASLGCDRMVVGHTIQDDGITPHCDQRVWCIDTGASAHYGGSVQILEISDGGVRVLR